MSSILPLFLSYSLSFLVCFQPRLASVNYRYSAFYVLYPIGVGAEFWTTMSAVKEAYAWNPLYAMFMIAVFVGYIPGKPLASLQSNSSNGADDRIVYALYAYDETETESFG